MIQIIKKDGSLESFNPRKIWSAIDKSAARVFINFTDEEHKKISNWVKAAIKTEQISVSDVHNLVEMALDACGFNQVAESYRSYRNYKRDQLDIMAAEELKEIELNREPDRSNANCNSQLISTKKILKYGAIQEAKYMRFFLTPEERKATEDGYIYPHDKKDRLETYNCFRRDTRFITSTGVKSFYDFYDGDKIKVLTPYGNWKNAVVRSYGYQRINEITLVRGGQSKTVYCTGNHRWLLKDGSFTTNLSVGNHLFNMPDFTDYDWDDLSIENKKLWCKGFALGDGTVRHEKACDITAIRLCGHKIQDFAFRFEDAGYTVTTNNDVTMVYMRDYSSCKKIPWLELNYTNILYYIDGLMSADGNLGNGSSKYRGIQVTGSLNNYIYDLLNIAGFFVTSKKEITNSTNYGKRSNTTIRYHTVATSKTDWTVKSIVPSTLNSNAVVWCLEVEDDEAFILEGGIPTGNCCLLNVGRVMKGGFKLANIDYTEPGSVASAIAVASDIISVTAGNQYGGLTWPQVDEDLAPYCQKSYDFYFNQRQKELDKSRNWIEKIYAKLFKRNKDQRENDEYAYERVKREIEQGYQGIEHTYNSVQSCRKSHCGPIK